MRLRSFKAHCETKGIDLLPDDYRFIDMCLNYLPKDSYKSILEDYLNNWNVGSGSCYELFKSNNLGRRYANEKLRELVNKTKGEKSV